jgi:REP element-mobilizing transposase RayT
MPDHVHMMIAIPPKHAVSQVAGFIKGKRAIVASDAKPLTTASCIPVYSTS